MGGNNLRLFALLNDVPEHVGPSLGHEAQRAQNRLCSTEIRYEINLKLEFEGSMVSLFSGFVSLLTA